MRLINRINNERKFVEEDENKYEIIQWNINGTDDDYIIIKFIGPELYSNAFLYLELKFTHRYPMQRPLAKFMEPVP